VSKSKVYPSTFARITKKWSAVYPSVKGSPNFCSKKKKKGKKWGKPSALVDYNKKRSLACTYWHSYIGMRKQANARTHARTYVNERGNSISWLHIWTHANEHVQTWTHTYKRTHTHTQMYARTHVRTRTNTLECGDREKESGWDERYRVAKTHRIP